MMKDPKSAIYFTSVTTRGQQCIPRLSINARRGHYRSALTALRACRCNIFADMPIFVIVDMQILPIFSYERISYVWTDRLHQIALLLKADRPHPRNYPHTPTDYRHTDKQPWEHRQTDGRTDGRYQVHYLPRFAVDNKFAMLKINGAWP